MKRTVKKVLDGDTFLINRKIGNTNIVRLAGVDAPEKHQFGGQEATNKLRGLIGGKTITLTPRGISYNRVVADVRCNRKSVNKKIGRW